MVFRFDTEYNLKIMTAMAKVLRKTLRKKRNLIIHIFGWIIIIVTVLLSIPWGNDEFVLNSSIVTTWIAVLIMLVTILFEDKINGYFASKKMLPNDNQYSITFDEDGYVSSSNTNTTQWKYENIVLVGETKDYFVFLLSKKHAKPMIRQISQEVQWKSSESSSQIKQAKRLYMLNNTIYFLPK